MSGPKSGFRTDPTSGSYIESVAYAHFVGFVGFYKQERRAERHQYSWHTTDENRAVVNWTSTGTAAANPSYCPLNNNRWFQPQQINESANDEGCIGWASSYIEKKCCRLEKTK